LRGATWPRILPHATHAPDATYDPHDPYEPYDPYDPHEPYDPYEPHDPYDPHDPHDPLRYPTMPAVAASIARVPLSHLDTEVTDGQLVELVRRGDTAAFGELVARHRGAVYRAALAALGNDADAEDIAQEALVLAFRRIDQFRADSSLRTWMVSIAWRLSLSRRRRLWWQVGRKSSSDAELPGLRAVSPSQEDSMLSAEFIRTVQQHIRRLPPKLRDALLLVAAGDLTQDEIAAALQIPAATFRGRVRDARLKLKAQLQH
jgi:RNA polymerase sigma-70 factor (ECF subfamily)